MCIFIGCRKASSALLFMAFSSLAHAKITEIARYDLSAADSVLKPTIKPDFSNDARFVLAGYEDGFTNILDAQTGKLDRKLPQDYDAALFTPDGQNIFTLFNGTATLNHLKSRTTKPFGEISDLSKVDNSIIWTNFSNDGERLVSILAEGEVFVWQAKKQSPMLLSEVRGANAAFFTEKSDHLVTLNQAHTIQIWQIAKAEGAKDEGLHLVKSYDLNQPGDRVQKWPQPPIFSKDGQHIFAVLKSGKAILVHAQTGEKIPLELSEVRRATFSDDGEKLFAISQAGVGSIWSVPTGKLVVSAGEGMDSSFSLLPDLLRFSPNGSSVLVVSRGDGGRLWESNSSRFWNFCPEGILIAAKFSLDGKKIFTIEEQGVVQVWQIDDQQEIRVEDDSSSFLND